MQRSPHDPREPQDQRMLIFLLLAVSVFMFSQSFMRAPVKPNPNGDEVAEKAGADAAVGQGDAEQDGEPAANEGDTQPPDDEPEIEEAPAAAPQVVSLGTTAATSPHRLMMLLTNQGAAIRRLVLASDEYHDIDRRSGSLGVVELSDAAGGAKVDYVAPGSPAADAGLAEGDVIKSGDLEAGGSKLKPAEFEDEQQLTDWLEQSSPGDLVSLGVEGADGKRTVKVTLKRPSLQLIRPESENLLLHHSELPEDFEEATSLLVTLDRVGKLKSTDERIEQANKRLREEAWGVEQADSSSVVFTMRLADLGLEVVKQFELVPVTAGEAGKVDSPSYHFDFEIEVRNLKGESQDVAYQLQGPSGLPIEGYWYANKIGRNKSGSGAWWGIGLRDVIVRYNDRAISQMNATDISKEKYDPFGKDQYLAYIGVDAQYFSVMMLPKKTSAEDSWFDHGEVALATQKLDKYSRTTLNNPTFTLTSRAVKLDAAGTNNAGRAHAFTVFAGPKKPDLLQQYKPAGIERYSLQDTLYYGWFSMVAKLMLKLLHGFHFVVRNYGIAIVMLTVVVRLCMFPLSRKQMQSMVRMQELKPEMDKIAEKYKNDMEKRSKAQNELYRKHNFHPMSGCLPAFIQLPIFLGLFRALAVDVELREASLLGGWTRFCSNLAAPDMFYDWSAMMPQWVNNGFLPSFVGIFALGPYFNLLPILTVCLYLLQQKMFMPPPANEQAALQQKMMKYMMGFMGLMFFRVPSGLCLYFISSTLWVIGERKLFPPPKPKEGTPSPAPAAAPKKPSGGAKANQKNSKKKKRKR